jgi:hypothetical protein
MISGELVVAESNSITQPLTEGKPDRVRVYFRGEAAETPCAAGVPDQLYFELVQDTAGNWGLLIGWVVAGTRTICWEADY